ncbi:efflux RND transporter periplasmic adaptor subunit [Halovulum dunhuangense]|uniref:Efflux RND transporter periplasmic adaptor subunit n=1 Tax=Halovulum dunhuangense TaxID=1505036 RepID=A0A849L262_9RHOB|nr:efflux RND transporter periplasmic adaptor subunit [Halovulum dunhuangense]NNU80365.1 efflux RND transporter periplasmic adaptor subunit [Halovulum dunhuangense]
MSEPTPQADDDGALRPDGGATAGISMLEQSLWRRLAGASGVEETAQAWAPAMFSMLDAADFCVVFLHDPDGGRLRPVAGWPQARMAGGALIAAAETAIEQDRGTVRGTMPDENMGRAGAVALAVPLSLDGRVAGAVGLEFAPRSRAELHAAMRRLQWGAAWMRDALRADAAQGARRQYDRAVHALHAVAAVAERGDFPTAARAAATDLATRFGCDRVSVGFRRLGRSHVVSISHSAQFGRRMTLVRLLAAAMDEAIDQRGVILFPQADEEAPLAAHRHAKLARAQEIGHILTVPLFAVDRFVGAILFERPADAPFTQGETEMLEAVATVLAPVLEEKRRNDRWLVTKAADLLAAQFARLVGPGRLARKAGVLALLAVVAFFWVARDIDQVSADARIEGAVQRTIAAPFDGFIAEAGARAGETVSEGQLLVKLDDRELALERLRLETQFESQRIEYDRALAQGDRAEASIRRNQMDQSQAQIALVTAQIGRTAIRAPFDGIVTSGDLSQSIGASVGKGSTLMTVAPAENYRIVMNVDERRIADIVPGQAGSLLVTALPDRSFAMVVRQVTPVAEYAGGTTTFRVEADLTEPPTALQPGMEGVAKVDIAERRLIAIWTRPMVDWFKVWSWRWFGREPE